jgi:hypothetical protein
VQPENFEWVLEHAAKYLIELAEEGRKIPTDYTWSEFLSGKTSGKSAVKAASAAAPAPKAEKAKAAPKAAKK